MGLLDSINHDFAKSIRKKNYSKELPAMLEETLEALTMLKLSLIVLPVMIIALWRYGCSSG